MVILVGVWKKLLQIVFDIQWAYSCRCLRIPPPSPLVSLFPASCLRGSFSALVSNNRPSFLLFHLITTSTACRFMSSFQKLGHINLCYFPIQLSMEKVQAIAEQVEIKAKVVQTEVKALVLRHKKALEERECELLWKVNLLLLFIDLVSPAYIRPPVYPTVVMSLRLSPLFSLSYTTAQTRSLPDKVIRQQPPAYHPPNSDSTD